MCTWLGAPSFILMNWVILSARARVRGKTMHDVIEASPWIFTVLSFAVVAQTAKKILATDRASNLDAILFFGCSLLFLMSLSEALRQLRHLFW